MNNKEFRKLKAKWDKKLKKSGFNDIEYADGSIASCLPRTVKSKDILQREMTQAYYNMTSCFLHDHKFESDLEKIIWEYHSEGISVRSISKLLKDTKVKKMGKTPIWTVINRLQKIMKQRYLKP